MKIVQLNSTLKEVVSNQPSLSSYLNSLAVGRKATPHSWLYENEKWQETQARWQEILNQVNAGSQFGDQFIQFESRQLEKVGPQGEVPPVSEALEVYEDSFSPSKFDDPMSLQKWFEYTKPFAEELFGKRLRTKRRLSIDAVLDDMQDRDTLTTNSGLPLFTRRNKVREQSTQDALSGKAYEYPAIVLFRKYNGKLRGVWMYPMSLNLLEGQFAQLIQAEIRNSPTPWVKEYVTPWEGFEDVKVTVTSQWQSDIRIFGGDTTAMDAHMRLGQTRLVFECVKWLFQETEWEDLWKNMEHVNTIDLLVGPDSMTSGVHGYSSGAGWTQLGETILQMFMAWVKKTRGQGIGDDFYWINLNREAAKAFVDFMAEFGLPAKEEKQSDEEDQFSFLQRLFHRGFFSRENPAVLGGYYPTIRALNSSLNPEKFHKPKDWSTDMFCVRQYMILENCVDDPAFEEFVKFVVKGQRDLVPFANKSAQEQDTAQEKARLIPGLNPSYNQEKRKKPLSSFTSIAIAREMS